MSDEVKVEVGWLIERTIAGRAWWWSGGVCWTTDSMEAVRFARREDAERVMRICYGEWLIKQQGLRALEHAWG